MQNLAHSNLQEHPPVRYTFRNGLGIIVQLLQILRLLFLYITDQYFRVENQDIEPGSKKQHELFFFSGNR